jgi:hypothetical protein
VRVLAGEQLRTVASSQPRNEPRPGSYHFAPRQGLQDADADDMTQTVLEGVSRTIREFE